MLSKLRGLPPWVQVSLISFVVAAIAGLGAVFNWTLALMLLGGLVLLALVLWLFFFLRRRLRQRRAEEFGGELGQQSSLTPRGISDPARQARLDDLRKSFNAGVGRFRAVGKDLYQLPWYLIVGEPGAGKTEAIRHSGVGFPPGMQDELQGVGGTINMNWWFTNQAVILDTAGRLMFEEVEPGTTNEWREFLGLLKRHRPTCPVNGIFLALPADSLIRDEPAEIQRKAGRIARQLEVVQKQFDLRFPVFVLITKCDLLNGFREFFDGLDDPNAVNQMIGWSNPDGLDVPFRPETVDAHLETSLARLRRRRLALLTDPVARAGAQASRLDETDRLFALPQSLALVAPRLRRYLEIIFTAGEWSAKPLFLRGIYFTSSLREGSALDQELAEAIGVPVDSLPEGRAWEREETRFLKDVFTEKAFREKGLVTRATDTRRLLRQRQFAIFGAGFAAVLLLGLLSFFGFRSLRRSIGLLGGYWLRAAEGWNKDDQWRPVVAPGGNGKPAAYVGDQPVGPGEREATRLLYRGGGESVVHFQSSLREVAGTPVSVPWIFRPLVGLGIGPEAERHSAQRVVFENSVAKPLLDAARERMVGPDLPAGVTAETEDNALLALVRLEAATANHVPLEADGGETWAKRFFGPLLLYATGRAAGEDTRPLAEVAAWTYSKEGSGEGWAPDWLSGGSNLQTNKAIAAGLNRLAARIKAAVADQNRRLAILGELASVAKEFRDRENELFTAVTARDQPQEKIDRTVFELTGIRGDLAPPAGTLKDRKLALDRKLTELSRDPGGIFDANVSLRVGYERGVREVRRQAELVNALLAECEPFAPQKLPTDLARQTGVVSGRTAKLAQAAADAFAKTGQHVLFNTMAERLRALQPDLEVAAVAGKPNEGLLEEWRGLDEGFLAPYGNGQKRLYAWRFDAYEAADRVAPGRGYAQSLPLLGSEWKGLKEVFDKVAAARAQTNAYDRPLKDRLLGIVGYSLNRAERFHSGQFPEAYLAQLRDKLRATARYPLTYPPGSDAEVLNREELRAAGRLSRQVEADLKAPVYASLAPSFKAPLAAYAAKLGPWQTIVNALTNDDGSLASCTVTLLNGNQQRQLGGTLSALDVFPAVELRDGTIRHGSRPSGADVAGRTTSNSPVDLRLAKFPVDEAFHFHFFRGANDQNVAVDLPCGENYTAVRLANGLLGGGGRAEGDGWLIPVRPDAQRTLWVRVNFPRPLPAVNDWPTRGSLEVGD